MPPPPTFDVRLARSRMLSPNVRELGFERVDGVPFDFQAGQWVSFVLPLPDGEGRRAYSIASAPDGSPGLAIAVTKVEGGPGSTFLHDLPEGATVRAIGPQGFFTRPRGTPQPSLFIGTGTGVTPLRSMILDALGSGDESPMTLLFGVRHPEDRLYVEELTALAARHSNLRVEYTLSKPPGDWSARHGYVQTHVEELWRDLESKNAGPPHAYVCGLERMVGSVRDLLRKQMGIERKQVHSERYD
ncbi:MAG: oxidoreductase [Myxococcales bacterium 68-20]|nr:FAD-dependent oxidoreductase [Myxococcales bacterium]OJY30947.1 MAG: oxidoreductase [Myxococcales bacterium 68-20]